MAIWFNHHTDTIAEVRQSFIRDGWFLLRNDGDDPPWEIEFCRGDEVETRELLDEAGTALFWHPLGRTVVRASNRGILWVVSGVIAVQRAQ